MRYTSAVRSFSVAAAGLMLAATSHAAVITWSAPTNIVGDSDVITTGSLVMAYNFSQTQLPVTVNGVLFSQFAIPNGANAIVGNNLIATIGFQDLESSDTSYGSLSSPFTSLSASYQTLLGSGMGSSTGATLALNLYGLNNGSTYIFQWWSNDSSLQHGDNFTTASAGNSVALRENVGSDDGRLGQWAWGTFTATGSSQLINISGPRPEINAFQLRELPTPGAAALLGLGGLMIARRRRS